MRALNYIAKKDRAEGGAETGRHGTHGNHRRTVTDDHIDSCSTIYLCRTVKVLRIFSIQLKERKTRLPVVRFAAPKILVVIRVTGAFVHKRSSPSLALRVALAAAGAVYTSHGRLGAARRRALQCVTARVVQMARSYWPRRTPSSERRERWPNFSS